MPSRPPIAAPSLLDRLVDACHGVAEPGAARLDRLVDDIEALLNTTCVAPADTLDHDSEAASSVLTYGAPAPASLAIASRGERIAAARRVQRVLSVHEPRLTDVRVRVVDPDAKSFDGRLRIDATVVGAGPLSLGIVVSNSTGRTHVTAQRP